MFDFAGKAVLITGAASGIGAACAGMFREAGADLLLCDLNADALEASASSLGGGTGRVVTTATDVTDVSACQMLAEMAGPAFGGLDVVVPSAGIYRDELFSTMTAEQWRRTMSVNLDGVFNTISAALPLLRGGGSVVVLSSRAGHCGGSVGHAHYGATKGAILALMRGLARELGPRIRLNAVSPGVIDTPMNEANLSTQGDALLSQIPLARFGSARDVAAAVLFLASDHAAYITGEAIQVNGGIYMG
uniref:SDR family NAD(P)-dependent oxidoreductase n=1 Tax=uncultured Sphingomonas sp. TaxID=158754 RepID=UPI0035C97790